MAADGLESFGGFFDDRLQQKPQGLQPEDELIVHEEEESEQQAAGKRGSQLVNSEVNSSVDLMVNYRASAG